MPVGIVDRDLPCLLVYGKISERAEPLLKKTPLPLLSIGNRYLIEHQLEWLSDQGFKKTRFSLSDRVGETERLVESGSRWGVKVEYSVDPEFLSLKDRLKKHRRYAENGILLSEGATLARFKLPDNLDRSMVFVHQGEDLPLLYLQAEDYLSLLEEADFESFEDLITLVRKRFADLSEMAVQGFFHRLESVDDFIEINRRIQGLLHEPIDPANQEESFHFKGSTRSRGIQIGRQAKISPRAKIQAPSLIGDGAYIKEGAELGPGAFIGDRTLIESGAQIVDSVVAPGTYIGRNTSFKDQYICKNYVLDLKQKTYIFIDDPLILGDLNRYFEWSLWTNRALAFFLLPIALVMTPILIPFHRLFKGRWLTRKKILGQPIKRNLKGDHDFHWKYWHRYDFGLFLLDIWPSIFDIARGHLAFVGNPPISPEDMEDLDPIWQSDRLKGKAGFTGHVQLLDQNSIADDDVFTNAIYYNATRTFVGDVKLFMKAIIIPGLHRTR